MLSLGWFSTGRDEAARSLLATAREAIQTGDLKARIAFIFCNRGKGEDKGSDLFIQQAQGYGLPVLSLSSRRFGEGRGGERPRPGALLPPWRYEYDREVMRLISSYQMDLGVLAGYMLIVGEEFCHRYPLINLHPALPLEGPAGSWQEVIWQLIETKATRTGAMMHLVTPELDRGPPVAYCSFSLRSKAFLPLWKELQGRSLAEIKAQQGEDLPLFRLIRRYGLAREFPLILETLKAFASGEIRTEGGRVVDREGRPIPGYDLSRVVNRAIRERL